MTQPVLVTGGTGTLGRRVVARLRDAGCAVRVLSRHARPDEDGIRYLTGDLATGAGIGPAVDGVRAIVHCAGGNKGDDVLTRNLVEAVKSRGGAPHLVFISVVGADRVPVVSAIDRAMFSYFGSKLAAERVVAESGLPWTTLRATQFHDLVLMVARQLGKLPVIPLPSGSRFQPVETDEVAARLVKLTLGEPAGLVPDIAGPQIVEVAELMRGYLRAAGRRRPILHVRLPGRAAAAVRAGAILAPEHATGKRTWEEFLADQHLGGH
ncbi:MAG: NAD(P)H-binding protein [Micromonosporaceae bacterium]|jgi:uncharacterized protein YbjT (DUF2867 family)|nr:NAD(P)H-binding protein [Micromonosporaceae bacterium]